MKTIDETMIIYISLYCKVNLFSSIVQNHPDLDSRLESIDLIPGQWNNMMFAGLKNPLCPRTSRL